MFCFAKRMLLCNFANHVWEAIKGHVLRYISISSLLKMKYRVFLLFSILCVTMAVRAAGGILNDSVAYRVEGSATVACEGRAPLWLTSNRHGLSSLQEASGYLRLGVWQPSCALGKSAAWKLGYGADLVVPVNYATENPLTGKQRTNFIVQQLYADVDYRLVRLSVGAKERPMAMKHQALSSGSQTLGINARPIPQVRLELPEYVSLTGRENPWLAIKGYFGFGMATDGAWQGAYVPADGRYADGALVHTKAGYMRVGNPERFPLVLEGGLEMATQFGGTIYNPTGRAGRYGDKLEMGQGAGDFLDAIIGTGSDATDGAFLNAAGNTLGSWLFSLTYQAKDWSVRAYYDHFFEDHSMMFFQYGWLDGMVGLEVQLPKNRLAHTLVYEYIKSDYQAGPVYHDHTAQLPDQVSGRDNYYNHNLYPGWQHWGQAMGNPLFTSPLYAATGDLTFPSNRFVAHHVGIQGMPVEGLNYRLLLSYATHLGTYTDPYLQRKYMTSGLMELNYNFNHFKKLQHKGWEATATFAFDRGKQVGNNLGVAFSIKKTGFLLK